MADNRFSAEYAKTGRSKCKDKDCKQLIDQGVLRLAKICKDPFNPGEYKNDWFHPACLWSAMGRFRPGTKKVESTDDIEGFDELKKSDQQEIKDLVAGKGGSGGGKKKAAAKKKAKKGSDDDDDEEEEKPKKRRRHRKRKQRKDRTMMRTTMKRRRRNRKRNAQHRKRRQRKVPTMMRTTNPKKRNPKNPAVAVAAVAKPKCMRWIRNSGKSP